MSKKCRVSFDDGNVPGPKNCPIWMIQKQWTYSTTVYVRAPTEEEAFGEYLRYYDKHPDMIDDPENRDDYINVETLCWFHTGAKKEDNGAIMEEDERTNMLDLLRKIKFGGSDVVELMRTECADKYDFEDMYLCVLEKLDKYDKELTTQNVARVMDAINEEYGSDWNSNAVIRKIVEEWGALT